MDRRRLLLSTLVLAAGMIALLPAGRGLHARAMGPAAPPAGPWPPVDPEDIVNLRFDRAMTAGESATVYKVPAKRHLVLTEVGLVNASGGFDAQLVERTRNGTVVKLVSSFTVESTLGIGIAFRPDSSVDVVNTRTKTDQVTLTLFGYLAPNKDWPPAKPGDLFDTYGTATFNPGEKVTIFDVPQDQWLVLTTAQFRGAGYTLLEDAAGTLTEKPRFFSDHPQVVGITFPPGSSVVLRNDEPFGTRQFWWLMTGYLAKD